MLVAMAGSIAAIFYPFLALPLAVHIILKLALGVALSAILFVGKCKYVKGMLSFFSATFLFGGCVFFVGCMQYGNATDALTKPLSIGFFGVVAASLALYAFVHFLSVSYHRRRNVRKCLLEYRMVLNGWVMEGSGFMDTGNCLYDMQTGLPVVIIGVKSLLPYLSDSQMSELFSGHADRVFAGARKMPCSSVGGKSALWLVEPQQFEVYSGKDGHIVYDVMVGLSFSAIAGDKTYNAILHPALTEGNAI